MHLLGKNYVGSENRGIQPVTLGQVLIVQEIYADAIDQILSDENHAQWKLPIQEIHRIICFCNENKLWKNIHICGTFQVDNRHIDEPKRIK